MPREEVLRRRSLDHHQTTDFQSEVCLSTPDTLPRCRRVKSISSKGSPFGDAVPREQVLWQRGIDPSDLDLRIDQKAHHTYTPRQDAELDAVQRELGLKGKGREATLVIVAQGKSWLSVVCEPV